MKISVLFPFSLLTVIPEVPVDVEAAVSIPEDSGDKPKESPSGAPAKVKEATQLAVVHIWSGVGKLVNSSWFALGSIFCYGGKLFSKLSRRKTITDSENTDITTVVIPRISSNNDITAENNDSVNNPSTVDVQ